MDPDVMEELVGLRKRLFVLRREFARLVDVHPSALPDYDRAQANFAACRYHLQDGLVGMGPSAVINLMGKLHDNATDLERALMRYQANGADPEPAFAHGDW